MGRLSTAVSLLPLFFVLGGCAATSSPQQAEPVAGRLPGASPAIDGRRLFYIGLALYSEAWAENDVVERADLLQRARRYHVVPMPIFRAPVASRRSLPPARVASAPSAAVTWRTTQSPSR